MNPWALPSLIAGSIIFILGVYIVYKDPKKPLNRIFALLILSWVITELSLGGLLMTVNIDTAILFAVICGISYSFIFSLLLHFTLIFAKKDKLIRKPITYVFLYLPPLILALLMITTDLIFVGTPEEKYWGYHFPLGDSIWVFQVYVIAVLSTAIYFVSKSIRTETGIRKKQGILIISALVFTLISALTFETTLSALGVEATDTISSILDIIPITLIAIAVLKYKLFVIESRAEKLVRTPRKYHLEENLSYFLKEEESAKSFDIFSDQALHDIPGLCVTKLPPETVRQKYEIAKTPIIWLTFKEVEDAISPKDLDRLESAISDFVVKTQKSCILLDCFREIVLINGFKHAMSFLKEVKNICKMSCSNLLVSIDQRMFDEKQMIMIQKEMVEAK